MRTHAIVFLIAGWICLIHSESLPAQSPSAKSAASVPELIRQAGGEDSHTALAAMARLEKVAIDQKLGRSKHKVIELCARRIHDDDRELAEQACEVLEWLDEDAAPRLIAVVQSDDADAKGYAVRAILGIATRGRADVEQLDAAIPHLAKLLSEKPGPTRHNAFYAISALGPRAVPHMIAALDSEEYFVRVMTKGFVRHARESIGPLCEELRKGNTASRRSAARVLEAISWQAEEAAPQMQRDALGPLAAAINDDDLLVRTHAIQTLGRMKGRSKPSVGRIIAALRAPDAPYSAIARAVARIGPETDQLDDLFDGAARAKAAMAHGDEDIAQRFGAAVGAVGENGVDRVVKALTDERPIVRSTAMYALFHLGPKASPAVPLVIERLNAGDPLAPLVLGAIGPQAKEAVPHLIRRMKTDTWIQPATSRWLAHHSPHGEALAAIGPSVLPQLLEGLKHENPRIRAGCLVALERMPREAMAPSAAITELTRDKHAAVRVQAMLALLKHSDPDDSLPILQRLAKDENRAIANMATQRLHKLSSSNE